MKTPLAAIILLSISLGVVLTWPTPPQGGQTIIRKNKADRPPAADKPIAVRRELSI